MRKVAINCIAALFAALLLSTLAAAASEPVPEWATLYLNHIERVAASQEDPGMRSFMMLADLDRDGVPELLYGTNTPLDPEIRFEALAISGGQVVKVEGSTINGAHSLSGATLTLYKTQKNYLWMLVTNGLESPNGKRQTRYTQIKYESGSISSINRFTKRWSGGGTQYFVRGYGVGRQEYNKKYRDYRSKIKRIGRVPQVSLGDASKAPGAEQLNRAMASLIDQYRAFAAPQKAKLVESKLRLKIGEKQRVKLGVSPAYASATRGTPVWSSRDPDIATVDPKGNVRAVGYGTTIVQATLPDGTAGKAKVTVPRPKVKRVTIQAESKTLKKGEQMQLFYRLSPQASRASVKWTSADPAVAQVDEHTGVVTAMKRGKVRISCWVNKKIKGGIALTVVDGRLAGEIQLTAPERGLVIGESVALGALVLPENTTNKRLNWRSSNSGVASVNQAGWVTAKGAGTATISASALGGARASVRVTVAPGSYQQRATVPDGVYSLSLKTRGALALSVAGHAAEERAPLVMESDVSGANQRFIIKGVEGGLLEIRPLIAPDMVVGVYQDPSIEDLGPRLGLVSGAEESECRFSATRFSNGTYAFRLASDEKTSFGAVNSEDGASVQLTAYSETVAERRFLLSKVGEAPVIPKEQAAWARAIRGYLKEHEAEAASWSHIELADLDFNGAPELIIYTGKRDKSVEHSATAQHALIFSAQMDGDALPGSFEYEPGPNTDYKDAHPKVRLLVDGKNGERSWVLTDGMSGRDTGSIRYTRIRYSQGLCVSEPLLEKKWKPAANTRSGLSDERFFANGQETTAYGYNQAYEKLFADCKWGSASVVEIECQGRPLEQITDELEIAIASKNWYQ